MNNIIITIEYHLTHNSGGRWTYAKQVHACIEVIILEQ